MTHATSPPMPALFVGHGAPFTILSDNPYVRAWRTLGLTLPRPQAIVVVSAHWLTPGKTLVTAMPQPRTIHDFGRMDARLFNMQYPAPGSTALAHRIAAQITSTNVELDESWGLDHGSWCVLQVMYPQADIPVVQLSLDATQSAAAHYRLAQELAGLRHDGVLIIGSGNIVHNLRLMQPPDNHGFAWASRFEQTVCEYIDAHDHAPLLDYRALGEDAKRAIPTPEHYVPLLYVLALREQGEGVSYPVEGFTFGSISMRSVLVGDNLGTL